MQIDYHDLKPDTEKSLQIFTCLVNPVTEEETKRIRNLITMIYQLMIIHDDITIFIYIHFITLCCDMFLEDTHYAM